MFEFLPRNWPRLVGRLQLAKTIPMDPGAEADVPSDLIELEIHTGGQPFRARR
jgi:hypothetical protein